MTDFLSRRLRDKGIIAIIALIFSITLWFRVVGGENIEATKVVRLEYKIPKDLNLFSPFQAEVTVRVRGPAPFINEFQKQDLSVVVDLTKFGTGEHEVNFRAEQFKIPLGIDLVMVAPSSIKIFLDKEMKKRVAVRPVLSTQLPEDYKIENMVVQPSTVEVKGSRIRLGLLNSLPTEVIYLTENSLNQHFEVPLNFSDFWGVEATEKLSTVHVEVNLKGPSKRKLFRDIPVKLRVGTPASSRIVDHKQRKIVLRPQTISLLLEGPEAALDELESNRIELWTRLTELQKGTYQTRLTWKLSPEIRMIDRSSDTVTVTVP